MLKRAQQWWADNHFDWDDWTYRHPGKMAVLTIIGLFSLFTVPLWLLGAYHSPDGVQGLAFCQKQCNTATLRLTSIELRDAEHSQVVCHCEVRAEAVSGSGIKSLDGGVL